MDRKYLWFGFMTAGPLTAYAAVFYPALSVLAIILIIIGLKGVMYDML